MNRAFVFVICLFVVACSPRPTQIPALDPTIPSDSDVEMEAAIQEARDTLDSFIQKISTPHPDRTHQTLMAVKVRFMLPDSSTQDLWVDQITYKDRSFHGTMGDDIPTLRLSVDDKITISRKDIVDWMIVEDRKLIGGYTIRLAYQRMSPEEKERFLKSINYSIED